MNTPPRPIYVHRHMEESGAYCLWPRTLASVQFVYRQFPLDLNIEIDPLGGLITWTDMKIWMVAYTPFGHLEISEQDTLNIVSGDVVWDLIVTKAGKEKVVDTLCKEIEKNERVLSDILHMLLYKQVDENMQDYIDRMGDNINMLSTRDHDFVIVASHVISEYKDMLDSCSGIRAKLSDWMRKDPIPSDHAAKRGYDELRKEVLGNESKDDRH